MVVNQNEGNQEEGEMAGESDWKIIFDMKWSKLWPLWRIKQKVWNFLARVIVK